MKTHKTRTVAHRRKREGRTDYKKRLKLLLSGKPRLAVRVSLKHITAQIITFNEKGDTILATASTRQLKQYGWPYINANTSSAYLVGLLIAKMGKAKGVQEPILDIGLKKSVPGSIVFAVLKGALDNGLDIPHSEDILPSEERVSGKHIAEYATQLKDNKELFERRFSRYLKAGADPTKMPETFSATKDKIIGA